MHSDHGAREQASNEVIAWGTTSCTEAERRLAHELHDGERDPDAVVVHLELSARRHAGALLSQPLLLCRRNLHPNVLLPRQHGALLVRAPPAYAGGSAAASPRGGDNEPGAACFMEAVMAEKPHVRPRCVLTRAFQGLEPKTGTASTGGHSARASHRVAWRPRGPARTAPRAERICGLEREA